MLSEPRAITLYCLVRSRCWTVQVESATRCKRSAVVSKLATKGNPITWAKLKDTFKWVAERWRQQLHRAKRQPVEFYVHQSPLCMAERRKGPIATLSVLHRQEEVPSPVAPLSTHVLRAEARVS